MRGYLGQSGSRSPIRHIENVDPRPLRTSCWWTQASHRPNRGVAIAPPAWHARTLTGPWAVRFPRNYTGWLLATFRRLLGFLTPYRPAVALSALLAALAMGATVLIPWLTGQAIDHIRSGDSSDLDRLGILIAIAGVGRLVLTVSRRLVAGRVSLAVEQ